MSELLTPSASEGTVLLTNVLGRKRTSLDGRWKAVIDPYDFGYVDLLNNRNRNGFYRDFKPRSVSDRVEYDFDSSMDLEVPGDWNTQDDRLLYYEGTVWYRTLFDIDPTDDPTHGTSTETTTDSRRRTFLNFGAANHTSRVFLDGEELCTHVGGFGQFATEVTGRVGPGRHSLVVQVNNRRTAERVPAMRSDWWNFGGITRSVDLVTVPQTFLRDAWLTMADDGRVVGGATVDGPGAEAGESVVVSLPDLGLSVALTPTATPTPPGKAGAGSPAGSDAADGSDSTGGSGSQQYEVGFEAEVERWAPGKPVLHRVRWELGGQRSGGGAAASGNGPGDAIEDAVGFRTVRTEGNRILVNDEPTFLKGIAIHGEGPSGGRRATGPEDAATLLGWAQDLGANFVRLAHYQHDEHMVREADRRGLLAWCELPVYWSIAYDNPDVLANAMAQADELVIRDRSRVSVALWSVANETLPGDGRIEFLTSLVDRVRTLDPTRLTTAALITLPTTELDDDGPGAPGMRFNVNDELGAAIDVVAINQYLGWYYGERERIPNASFTTPYGKPIVFSELGAGAKYGNHGGDDEIWTEEFQAAVYRAQLEMIEAQPDCVGLSPWILKDFRTPLRVLPGIQDGYNRKGLVSEEGERKLAFDVVADHYRSREG